MTATNWHFTDEKLGDDNCRDTKVYFRRFTWESDDKRVTVTVPANPPPLVEVVDKRPAGRTSDYWPPLWVAEAWGRS